ncbi:MAG TPA: hypothetical protein VE912_08305, partial [Bacteroidales bacterium]|nr:hypothetical protein [Bacteroidales bacterium]
LFILSMLILQTGFVGDAPDFIGMHKNDIIMAMKKEHRDFVRDDTFVNRSFNYLKYVDRYGEQTLLFFLSEKDLCTSIRLMCDYSYLDGSLDELNKSFQLVNDSTWSSSENGNHYRISLNKGDWFYTVSTKKE